MEEREPKILVFACEVFRTGLRHLELEARHPGLQVRYLPANLHMGPQRLRESLRRRVSAARKRGGGRLLCLYGDCFPGISGFCARHRMEKVPGAHCYEMLLGSGSFRELTRETAGIFFAERELIVNFERFCVEPLELADAEMRENCFRHYRKLLYIRQPSDPDLIARAGEEAAFLGLDLDIRDADYSELQSNLEGLIGEPPS